MFLLQNNKIIFLLIFFIFVGCASRALDPVSKVNIRFLQDYNVRIKEPREKHKKLAREVGINYTEKAKQSEEMDIPQGTNVIRNSEYGDEVSIPTKKDYNYALERGIPLLSYDDKVVESSILNQGGEKNTEVIYLAKNYPNYAQERVNFDDIYVPKDTLKKEALEKKDFTNVNNETLQESFDYMQVIKEEREKYRQELKKKMEAESKQEEKTIGTRVKKTVKSIKDRVKNLLK